MSNSKNNKSGKIMSLAIDVDIQEKMKTIAKCQNISVSKLIRDMVVKYLPDNVEEPTDIIIFKVPLAIKANAEELRKWLTVRVDSVVNRLTS